MNLVSITRRAIALILFIAGLQLTLLAASPDQKPSNRTPSIVIDTTKYRTATYRDWADAKDTKHKRKSEKPKPNGVDFRFHLSAPGAAASLKLSWSMFTRGSLHRDSLNTIPVLTWDSVKTVTYTPISPIGSGTLFIAEGHGLKGKTLKTKFEWTTSPKKSKGPLADSLYDANILRLPMPNLHNVGEDIYGGVKQTSVELRVGTTSDPLGSHTVYLPKYKDVLKSLIKEHKGGDIYHQPPPRRINTFDKNGKQILKRQKGLPPDKHSNILFADQLALKLNIAASDSGDFPPGFGDLIYDNLLDITPFNGLTLRTIATHVDTFLGTSATPFGVSDSTVYLRILANLDTAFAGPFDTISWSGDNVICTGVRPISSVPYLHAGPNSAPVTRTPSKHNFSHYTPSVYALRQNYPNPFNPTTIIEFELAQEAIVTVKVYNIVGQEVATLLDREAMDEGEQQIEFNAGNFPSGVYFYRLIANGIGDPEEGIAGRTFVSVKKMLLIK
jgi:type IX secretion system substrate protein